MSRGARIYILVVAFICIGCTLYAFSPYYIPGNYATVTGTLVGSQPELGSTGGSGGYQFAFTTRDGQKVIYKYQPIIPNNSIGPTITLYYNTSDPAQVKVKPQGYELPAELALSDVFIPLIATIVYMRAKRANKAFN